MGLARATLSEGLPLAIAQTDAPLDVMAQAAILCHEGLVAPQEFLVH
jgi:hypothetical protein